jgi:hypothetical protein
VVKLEHQIDSLNRGLVGEGAGEEVHQKKALEVVAGRSIEVRVAAAGRLIEVRAVEVERLIEVKAVGEVHSIEVRVEGEEARCLLMEEEVQDVMKLEVEGERVMSVQKAFSVVMVGEGDHLLVERHEHEIVAYLLREAGVELHLDLVLEVVLYFFVP